MTGMRFLAVTETCDLASLYMRLAAAGHEVRVHIGEALAQGTGAGLFDRTADWRAELGWVRAAADRGVIIFEAVSEGFGALQDRLRQDGYNVVGGSAFGDRLENDRAFAQDLLAECGLRIAPIHAFDDAARARAFIAAHPGRYVLKFSGPDSGDNYLGQRHDGGDVAALLAARPTGRDAFILMPFIDGVEIGVGAWFDGARFVGPACLDWEHKRFFAGDMGELTGEMGTVATFAGSQAFFDRTLARVASRLCGTGHAGWVNLNTIVNADGIWPLEFTCRFGYPGYAVLEPLQITPWAQLLRSVATGDGGAFETRPGFSTGIVLTTPPFPYTRKQLAAAPVGMPVWFDPPLDAAERAHHHYGEVGLAPDGQLVTSGLYGWTMVVTGTGASVAASRDAAYARASRVSIPNVRYRLDIGLRLVDRDLASLRTLGLFG